MKSNIDRNGRITDSCNHLNASILAVMQQKESNLARCYLDLDQRIKALSIELHDTRRELKRHYTVTHEHVNMEGTTNDEQV